jgi:Ras-related protein Rab-28
MSERSCSLSIIGDGSVGKSTIIAAFKSDGFVAVYKQTVGCDFYERKLQLRGEIYVSLRVWDIGGQSISSNNLPTYLGHSGAILLVYDVTNRESFNNLGIRPLIYL